mmetsp:Transcript_71809/g.158593  ORF Transcript_71809/g.158593 Transcript_71809/m.158593 type:complete len:350 (-) Transcript_71809:437-1486(-)
MEHRRTPSSSAGLGKPPPSLQGKCKPVPKHPRPSLSRRCAACRGFSIARSWTSSPPSLSATPGGAPGLPLEPAQDAAVVEPAEPCDCHSPQQRLARTRATWPDHTLYLAAKGLWLVPAAQAVAAGVRHHRPGPPWPTQPSTSARPSLARRPQRRSDHRGAPLPGPVGGRSPPASAGRTWVEALSSALDLEPPLCQEQACPECHDVAVPTLAPAVEPAAASLLDQPKTVKCLHPPGSFGKHNGSQSPGAAQPTVWHPKEPAALPVAPRHLSPRGTVAPQKHLTIVLSAQHVQLPAPSAALDSDRPRLWPRCRGAHASHSHGSGRLPPCHAPGARPTSWPRQLDEPLPQSL